MSKKMNLKHFLLAILPISLCLLMSACGKGPFRPDVQTQNKARDHYIAALTEHLSSDSSFEMKTLSSSIIVKSLYYAPEVESMAKNRFAGDPVFSKETKSWHGPYKKNKTDVIVLMGLYKPDLEENDVVKNGRFRPRLTTSSQALLSPETLKHFGRDGTSTVKPDFIKRLGRDNTFVRDYFPVFDPWEEVYIMRFSILSSHAESRSLHFLLLYPDGVQSMLLRR